MKIAYRVQGGLKFDADFEQNVIDAIALNASKHLSEVIAPHAVAAAQERCPVGQDRNFKPRKSSFSKVRLVSKLPPIPAGASPQEIRTHQKARLRLAKLKTNQVEVDLHTDAQFFTGTGRHTGQTPDALSFHRGGVAGAFRYQPGALKKSIKFDGVRREENRVIAVIRAHAHYARYVHEGFNHTGGGHVAPQKFLVQSFTNIREPLLDATAYG